MFSKMVVPLDGSKLAELVLPHIPDIVKGFNIKELMLVSVTQKMRGRLPRQNVQPEFVPESPAYEAPRKLVPTQVALFYWDPIAGPQDIPVTLGKMAKTAANYLRKTAVGIGDLGCDISATVLAGDPAGEIVSFAEEKGADLILIASLGQPGLSRWDMSKIAGKIIKTARATVIVVKPEPDFKETKSRRRGVAT